MSSNINMYLNMVALLEAIVEPDHYVYGLFLLNIDGSIDHCFYIGESDSPQDRLLGHRNEELKKNPAKWEYFKNYDHARIRMIVLLKNTMGYCSVIEKLFIQNEDKFGNFHLTNMERGGKKITLKCDTIAGLRDILNLGIFNNDGYNADSVQHSPAVKQRKSKARVVRSEEIHTENISAKFEALPPFPNLNNQMSNDSSSAENVQLNIPLPTIGDEIRDSNVKKLKESYVFTGGKKQLVNDNTLLDPSTINGTFLNMDESEFDTIVHDNDSSLAFAARCRLIKNAQECPNCKSRDMKVIGTDRTGRKWKCSYYILRKKKFCKYLSACDGSILNQNNITIFHTIRAIFFLSQGLENDEIISKFGTELKNRILMVGLLNVIKVKVIDVNLKNYSSNVQASSKALQDLFFGNPTLDHFGLLLKWVSPA